MKEIIYQQARHLGFDICDYDVEQIIDTKFHLLIKNGDVWIKGVRAAIRAYFR